MIALQQRRSHRRAVAGRAHAHREPTSDRRRAVEAPLARELAAARGEQPEVRVGARRARARASASCAASSPPRSANRSPSPVIGSMKPAASPASSSPGAPATSQSTASGPRQTGFGDHARGRKAIAQAGRRSAARDQQSLHRSRRTRSAVTTQALVSAARQRCDADVAAAGAGASRRSDVISGRRPGSTPPTAQRRGRARVTARARARARRASAAPSAAITMGAVMRSGRAVCALDDETGDRRHAGRLSVTAPARARLPRRARRRAAAAATAPRRTVAATSARPATPSYRPTDAHARRPR